MNRFCSICVTCLMCTAGWAQSYRSVSVWSNGKNSDFSLATLDSISLADDNNTVSFYANKTQSVNASDIDSITISVPDVTSTNKKTVSQLKEAFKSVVIETSTFKPVGKNNPLMGHKFGADPWGLVVGDRLYVYMTDDHLYRSTDGKPITGAYDYSDCKKVAIISSEDLVNWTDHGTQPVAGSGAPAAWAGNMWAPCAAYKTINGKQKYFLYFSNNSNGIGVLTADTPYGPWSDPKGGALINHSTANCAGNVVPSVYDPAVLIDDDGKAYLYFGGGTDNLDLADPASARCVQLGSNMTSIVGTPVEIRPPYHFEDSGINKVGGKYLYSYCAHFQTGGKAPGSGNIGYMKSDNPLGPFTFVGTCFENPGGAGWSGGGGNNHHAIVEFKGKYYILYHNRSLKSAMRSSNSDINDNVELRSTCISPITVDTVKAEIKNLTASSITQEGVSQLKNFDPYVKVPGATMAWEKNVTTDYHKSGNTYVCTAEMKAGSWMCLSKVDFQEGPIAFSARVKGRGVIKICTTRPGKLGKDVAYMEVESAQLYKNLTVPLVNVPTGVVNQLYIVSSGNLSIESWSFVK
ncbi:MAG: family 43 glycosylhydrolase [Bacteroidaceae bacterium]|nr:family 43 glycosylhydrolase [Bacteroidaceae bacterium]